MTQVSSVILRIWDVDLTPFLSEDGTGQISWRFICKFVTRKHIFGLLAKALSKSKVTLRSRNCKELANTGQVKR